MPSIIDTIKGACFAKFDGRMCAMPLMKKLTRTQCCCGMEPMGQRGWGQPCQGCPLEGSGKSSYFSSKLILSYDLSSSLHNTVGIETPYSSMP